MDRGTQALACFQKYFLTLKTKDDVNLNIN